jgi:hypothetical protein
MVWATAKAALNTICGIWCTAEGLVTAGIGLQKLSLSRQLDGRSNGSVIKASTRHLYCLLHIRCSLLHVAHGQDETTTFMCLAARSAGSKVHGVLLIVMCQPSHSTHSIAPAGYKRNLRWITPFKYFRVLMSIRDSI